MSIDITKPVFPVSDTLQVRLKPGLDVIKLFSCSTQMNMKFQLLIKTKTMKYKDFLLSHFSDVISMKLINVEMPTIVGIFHL